VTVAAKNPSRLARWLRWLWPLSLLLFAWLIAPLRAGATYPGMPCTATADTVFSLASYAVLFIPTAGLLLWLSRRLIPAALRRGLLAWAGGLTAVAIGIAIVFLAFAGVSADRRFEPANKRSTVLGWAQACRPCTAGRTAARSR